MVTTASSVMPSRVGAAKAETMLTRTVDASTRPKASPISRTTNRVCRPRQRSDSRTVGWVPGSR